MVVGAKVCELTDGFLWFVCGLYVRILTSPLRPDSARPEVSDGEYNRYITALSCPLVGDMDIILCRTNQHKVMSSVFFYCVCNMIAQKAQRVFS